MTRPAAALLLVSTLACGPRTPGSAPAAPDWEPSCEAAGDAGAARPDMLCVDQATGEVLAAPVFHCVYPEGLVSRTATPACDVAGAECLGEPASSRLRVVCCPSWAADVSGCPAYGSGS